MDGPTIHPRPAVAAAGQAVGFSLLFFALHAKGCATKSCAGALRSLTMAEVERARGMSAAAAAE